MSWNHPEQYNGKGKGKGGGYGGGWYNQQPAWQQQQQPAWQQQQQQEPSENAETAALLAKLKSKELELEVALARPVMPMIPPPQETWCSEETAEVTRLKEKLKEQDAEKNRLKRRLEEQESAIREREMEERVNQRVQAQLKQQKQEMEMRFVAATEPRLQNVPQMTPKPVATAGFTMRSGAGAWAEMEAKERQQKEESERKEQENKELRERDRRQQQENQRLQDRLNEMESLSNRPTPIGAGVFPSPERDERDERDAGGISDEELFKLRTDELAEWAELAGEEEKKREWQDLCCLHKVKKVGAKWPATPSGRKKWCERIAKAEIELTEAK